MAALFVFIGVVGEEIVELPAIDHDDRKRLKKAIKAFAIGVLLIGLAGDLAGIVMGQAEMTALTKEAGDAKDSAEKAEAAEKTVEGRTGQLETRLDTATRKLSTLSNEANDLGTDLDGIVETISARRVTDEKGLEDDLRENFKGRRIIFKSNMGLDTDEPFWLCAQLFDIAKRADVDPVDKCATEPLRPFPITNLLIDAPTIEEGERLAMILKKQRILDNRRIGRRVSGFSVALRGGMPDLVVMVGVRPSMPLSPDLHGTAKIRDAAKSSATPKRTTQK